MRQHRPDDGPLRRVRWAVVLTVSAVLLAGCGGGDESGAEATETSTVPPRQGPALPDESGNLDPVNDPYGFSYDVGYMLCSGNADRVYEESGTSDPQEAAEWYGQSLDTESNQAGGETGCLDGLEGRPRQD